MVKKPLLCPNVPPHIQSSPSTTSSNAIVGFFFYPFNLHVMSPDSSSGSIETFPGANTLWETSCFANYKYSSIWPSGGRRKYSPSASFSISFKKLLNTFLAVDFEGLQSSSTVSNAIPYVNTKRTANWFTLLSILFLFIASTASNRNFPFPRNVRSIFSTTI